MSFNPKKFYRRIADATHEELRKIEQLTPDQLDELLQYTNALNGTNCWWMEHRIKEVVALEIQSSKAMRHPATGEVR